MKKKMIYLALLISTVSLLGMDKPEESLKTPEKSERIARRRLFQETKTSPAKPGFVSPEPAGKKRGSKAKTHTGYTETERESEHERKYSNIRVPLITHIHNNFNYPILVVYPLSHASAPYYEAIKHGEFSKRKNIDLDGLIVINANNRIHEIEYIIESNKQYILDTIDDSIEMEPKITNKRIEIEIDKHGNLEIKPVLE